MIEDVIRHIDAQIDFTALGLSDLTHGEKTYPSVYSGGGDSEDINFDFYATSSYHRLTGVVGITQEDDETIGGDIQTVESYPMRYVAYFPNNLLGTDDAYSVHRVVSNLKNKLPANLNTIADSLGLYSVEVVLGGVEVDSFRAWGQEFVNVDFRVPSTHRLIYIDYDIILTGNKDCFTAYACD